MVEKYISLGGVTVTEKVIEKSRFITSSAHVSGDGEARAFIAEISGGYSDATHNCYAYIADAAGNFLRFSDDGEPQGTAGMPMLETLKNSRVFEACVVVTRYFGGIKLGAGGLVRAYSGCVAENLAAAKKVLYQTCSESEYTVDYPACDAALRFFSSNDCKKTGARYSGEATFTVVVKKEDEQKFNSSLLNALSGRVKIKKLREYFYPFEI